MAGKLGVCRCTDTDSLAQLSLDAGADADERGNRNVGSSLAEQRPLELCVRAVEGLVVPVESAAGLGDAHQKVDEHRAEQGVVLGRLAAGVGAGVDARGFLAAQLVECDRRIVATTEPVGSRVDEIAHQRSVLVERRAVGASVLLERERQRLIRVVELSEEVGERAEREASQSVVELRRPYGHAPGYAPAGAIPRQIVASGGLGCWHPGHQYAVRFRSPRPRERIGVAQRGQPRPARR